MYWKSEVYETLQEEWFCSSSTAASWQYCFQFTL